jgi:hypothetical protein
VRDQVSHPYKTTGKIAVLYILMFISTTVLLRVQIKSCTFRNISTAAQTKYPPSRNAKVHYSAPNSAPMVPPSARSVYPTAPYTAPFIPKLHSVPVSSFNGFPSQCVCSLHVPNGFPSQCVCSLHVPSI